MLRLGVLDQGSQRPEVTSAQYFHDLVAQVQLAESLGYYRYWIGEHHAPNFAHSCPEVVIARLAAATSRIIIGAAGILLRYYSPLKVAEIFLALEAMFPGRIELGVCRGPGVVDSDVASMLVWHNEEELTPESFPQKVSALSNILRKRAADLGLSRPPQPSDVPPPPMWILGSSERALQLAMANERSFGYMCFFEHGIRDGLATFSKNRAVLQDRDRNGLRNLIAVTVLCDQTAQAARERAVEIAAASGLSPNIAGDPKGCLAELQAMADSFDVRDVVMLLHVPLEQAKTDALNRLAPCSLLEEAAAASPSSTSTAGLTPAS